MDLSRTDWEYVAERAGAFVGREWMFTRVRSFLSGPPGTFLLRGDPGAGKTAVAARLAQGSCGRLDPGDSRPPPVGEGVISAGVFCRAGKVTVPELAQRLSDQLAASVDGFADALWAMADPGTTIKEVFVVVKGDVHAGATVSGVVLPQQDGKRAFNMGVAAPLRRLREQGAALPIVLLVDAVDEAADAGEVNIFARLLGNLDGVHLIVTCRPDPAVLFDFKAAEHKVDLIADAPTEDNDLRHYIRNRLRGQGPEEAVDVLADRITKEAAGNFLYAFYVTGALVQPGRLAGVDEKTARLLPLPTGGLPGVYEDFLDRQIGGDQVRWAEELRPVLAPICVALGDGFTTTQLASIANRLSGRSFSLTKARDITRAAGQFLDGPRPDGPFRAYHQSFARFLTDLEENPYRLIDPMETNIAVLAALRAEGADQGWPASSYYAKSYAPSHAAAVGQLERFFYEANFLVGMAPSAMGAAVRSLSATSRQDPVFIYDVALPFLSDDPGINAVVLKLVSQIQGNRALSQELDEVRASRPYKAVGNIRPFDLALTSFSDHTDEVRGVAVLDWPGLDHQVIVSASGDGTARVWDPLDLGRELARFDRHTDEVRGVAVLDWPGLDHQVIVSASGDGTARVWDPLDPSRELARFDRHTGALRGLAVLDWPGLNHQVIVTTSTDKTARVWDPLDPSRELARFDRHTDGVRGVAVLDWPGVDHRVIVTTSYDGTARVWDPLDPGRELARFDGQGSWLWGVATLGWPGMDHQVIVTTSFDWTARVWDPLDPSRELARFDRHNGVVEGVATLGWPGVDHRVIVTTSYDGTARVWDPLDPGRELARFDGHTGEVWEAATLGWPDLDHPVIVTASGDKTARVWDPLDRRREPSRFDGHAGLVWRVAALAWPGLDYRVIATASSDGTARVWDPLDPSRELARFDRHTGEVMGVAALAWLGLDHQVIVSASGDGTARVWDPLDPSRELARFDRHTGEVMGVAALAWPGLDHQVIVTTSSDKTARVWDPLDPGQELARLVGHTDDLWDVAVLAWPGLDHQVIVTTSSDKTARVWDPLDPGRELARFDRHTDEVAGVAVLAWPGVDHQVIVTAAFDGTARVWNPLDPSQELARFDRQTGDLWGVATLPWPRLDHQVIVTTSSEGTARVWDPLHPQSELARLALLGTGFSITALTQTTMAVGTSRGFLVLELQASKDHNRQ